MSNNNLGRAVYIPPAKRKRQNQQTTRFHGAFTGGFSAGYFNTVDTKEGWKPSVEKKGEQKLEDFMDEQDFQEWGGPTSVRQDFQEKGGGDEQQESSLRDTKVAAPLESLLKISRPLTVGPRLLRRLGWREGTGAAFVPADGPGDEGNGVASTTDAEDAVSKIHLSKRKLRQIRLQSSRIVLPPPKLDQCGLGFEAHENAPEFRRYREQRQELARQRARGQSNVYRVSSVLGGGEDKDGDDTKPTFRQGDTSNMAGGDYLSYETAEDFVGSRSVGGFALRDDEDDIYDLALGSDRNNGKPSAQAKHLSDEYHTEIVDVEDDSDVDDGPAHGHSTKSSKVTPAAKEMNAVLGGALASWAVGGRKDTAMDSNGASAPSAALTSSGRPPVAGFRLGGSMESHKKRYPGPDLPRDYVVKRHVFGPNERPAIFQTIGRAIQLEGEEQAWQQRRMERQHLPPPPKSIPRSDQPSLAGNQFATLAVAMKNRFTSESSTTQSGADAAGEKPIRIGLYQPPPVHARPRQETPDESTAPSAEAKSTNKEIAVHRTTQSFAPLPLLCKRFGVPVPRHVLVGATSQSTRVTEASYFEKEVLSTVHEQVSKAPASEPDHNPKAHQQRAESPTAAEEVVEVSRPPLEKLKSIFEPESGASSSADTDLDSMSDDESVQQDNDDQKQGPALNSSEVVPYKEAVSIKEPKMQTSALTEYQSRHLAAGKDDSSRGSSDDESSSDSASSRRKERKRKHSDKKRKKSSNKRKRSEKSSRHDYSSEDNDSLDSDPEAGASKERKRESKDRRRKHSKKRRKKHSSSHRK